MVLTKNVFYLKSQIQFSLPAALGATSPSTRKRMKRLWEELYELVEVHASSLRITCIIKKTTTYKPQVMLLSLHYLVRKICKAKLLRPVSTAEFGRR